MILTCENCLMRYLVPSSAIGTAGRTVRCRSCGHEWFQEPEDLPGETAAQVVSDQTHKSAASPPPPLPEEPIPDFVKPIPAGSGLPALPEDIEEEDSGGAVAGYLAAFVVLVLIGGGLFFFRSGIIAAWPPVVALYEMAGLSQPVVGEGLSFEGIKAVSVKDATGNMVLQIEGSIVNKQDKVMMIPPLEISLRTGDGATFDTWQVDPPQGMIDPQGQLAFKASYPHLPENVKEARVTFALVQ